MFHESFLTFFPSIALFRLFFKAITSSPNFLMNLKWHFIYIQCDFSAWCFIARFLIFVSFYLVPLYVQILQDIFKKLYFYWHKWTLNKLLIFFKIVFLVYEFFISQNIRETFDLVWSCIIRFLLMSFISSNLFVEMNFHFNNQEKITGGLESMVDNTLAQTCVSTKAAYPKVLKIGTDSSRQQTIHHHCIV